MASFFPFFLKAPILIPPRLSNGVPLVARNELELHARTSKSYSWPLTRPGYTPRTSFEATLKKSSPDSGLVRSTTNSWSTKRFPGRGVEWCEWIVWGKEDTLAYDYQTEFPVTILVGYEFSRILIAKFNMWRKRQNEHLPEPRLSYWPWSYPNTPENNQ